MQTFLLNRLSINAVLVLLTASCLPTSGSAQDEFPINGSVYIAGRHPINPSPNEAKNTHAYLTIRGPGAIRMYNTMTSNAVADLCRDGGWRIKRAGDFACSLSSNGKKAECDFSVELQRGALAPGSPC